MLPFGERRIGRRLGAIAANRGAWLGVVLRDAFAPRHWPSVRESGHSARRGQLQRYAVLAATGLLSCLLAALLVWIAGQAGDKIGLMRADQQPLRLAMAGVLAAAILLACSSALHMLAWQRTRQHSELLRISEERLGLAAEAAGLGVWDIDLTTGQRDWSAEMRAILGLAADAPIGRETFLERVHPDDRAVIAYEVYGAPPQAGGPRSHVFRIIRVRFWEDSDVTITNGLKVGQLGVTLQVREALTAAEFYKDVLGAAEVYRHVTDDGAGVHGIDLKLGDAHLTVATENPNFAKAPRPDWPRSPRSAGTTTAFFTLYVDDVDATVARALAAGATSPNGRNPVETTHWGDRVGQFVDPAGHVWRLQTAEEEVAFEDLPARLEAVRATHSTRVAQQAG